MHGDRFCASISSEIWKKTPTLADSGLLARYDPEDEPANIYALYVPSHGKRRRGRQATSYLKYIQQCLGDYNDQITAK